MRKISAVFGIVALTAGCMQDTGTTMAPATSETPATQQEAPSAPQTGVTSVTVDDTFAALGFSWDRTGAETFIRYRPVISDGEMYICGAYSSRGGSDISSVSRRALRSGTIQMNGTTVMRNMEFFNVVSNANRAARLAGTTANCRSTGLSPSNEDLSTLRLDIPPGSYRV